MGITLEYAERPACLVCGAPGGDCGPEDGRDDHPGRIMFEEWGPDYQPPESRRPRMDDVIAKEKVWEERPVPRSGRKTHILKYKVGDRIPYDEAVRLGVVDAPEPEPKPQTAETAAQTAAQTADPIADPIAEPAVPASLQKASRARVTPAKRGTAKKTPAPTTRARKKTT